MGLPFASAEAGESISLRPYWGAGRTIEYQEVVGVQASAWGRWTALRLTLRSGESLTALVPEEKLHDVVLAVSTRIAKSLRDGQASCGGVASWRSHVEAGLLAHESMLARVLLDGLIAGASAREVTDLHFQGLGGGMVAIRFRRHGVLSDLMELPLAVYERLATRVRVVAKLPLVTRSQPLEGGFVPECAPDRQVRVSILPSALGDRMSMRLLGGSGRSLEALRVAAADREVIGGAISHRQGLFLVCGPAGSGKTTLLYGCLERILRDSARHIVSLEDPIELSVAGVTQVNLRPTEGFGFAEGLVAALRHDPEVIMVGEVRDGATGRIAVEAALSGHLVLSAIHAGSTGEALRRLAGFGIPPATLEPLLRGVVHIRLERQPCSRHSGGECERCLGTGVEGLLPALEIRAPNGQESAISG